MTLSELLDFARANVQTEATWPADLQAAFKALAAVPYRGWIYHVPVPKEHTRIQYADVKMDHADYDYDKLIAHAVKVGNAVLVNEGTYPFNPLQPMYERVRAMCAYVHSPAFNSPTVFLDGDAFVNADLRPIFDAIADIGVTYRNVPGLMPINEGVIFAKPTDRTRAFFRSYLATYEHLAGCPEVISHYGDIKRWRGGQLSLNAISSLGDVHGELDHRDGISYLPCDIFNFSMDMDRGYTRGELDQKAVLHLKGPRKVLVDQIIAYQS